MNRIVRIAAAMAILLELADCGGGGGSINNSPPPPTDYNLQAGFSNLLATGLSANVSLSGTVIVNGSSVPFTGSGTYTRSPGTTAMFNGSAALSQTETLSGTIVANGQSAPVSTTGQNFYATDTKDFLGEVTSNEYGVAQTPFAYPTSVVGGSQGTLGTINRYSDSTLSVPIGTAQVTYSLLAAVDPGSPIGVSVTTRIYDTHNMLTETDVTNYTMTSANVLSFASASAQNSQGTINVKAN